MGGRLVNLPFVFGIGFFLRVFVPGIVAAFVVVMLQGRTRFGFAGLEGITMFLLLSGLLGVALRVLYPFVSEFLMGAYWPSRIRTGRIRSLERRLRDAEETLKHPPKDFSTGEGWRYAQAGRYVLLFPIDQFGNRSVLVPTLLGNIVSSYLSYLSLQYGLQFLSTRAFERHMTFVLTRLWYSLPPELRREVSDGLAESEALIGSATAIALGAALFLGKALVLALTGSWGSARLPFGLAAAGAALTWLVYSALVKQSVTAGAVYEALFGYVSRSELDRIIEQAKGAMAAQTEAVAGQTGAKEAKGE
jgi:hypothetical protein